MRLPRVEVINSGEVEYSLLEWPFPPMNLLISNSHGQRSESKGRFYVEWLKTIEVERVPYVEKFFASAGAPMLSTDERAILSFEDWLVSWVQAVYQPTFSDQWFYEQANGLPSFAPPDSPNYDPKFRELIANVALDIAFWTLGRARQKVDLQWSLSREAFGMRDAKSGFEPRSFLPTLSPGNPTLYPVSEAFSLMQTALVQPGSRGDSKIRQYYSTGSARLLALFKAMVSGQAIEFPTE
jgi:hypothetical protein